MMADNTNRGERERSKISLSEEYEVRYCTRHLGVFAEETQTSDWESRQLSGRRYQGTEATIVTGDL
jgi:hypothetical protein